MAILATGDELVEIDKPLTPGKIRNSNEYVQAALVEKYGGNLEKMGSLGKDRLREELLSISGIVQPRNISDDGTVAYDKIAEARISYGGKGTISDVQKPGWGHRIWNKLTPF